MFNISRFKDIKKREFDCEVVTPMFLGGANPKKAEMRAPSIKAVMRFWWRALYEGENIEEMTKDEAKIFGSTEKKSSVSVTIGIQNEKATTNHLPSGKKIMVTSKGGTFPISIIEYLAFGLLDPQKREGKYIKEHFEPNSHLKIILTFPKTIEADLMKALNAMISFGGLGSRSRNGFGSLHCDELTEFTLPKEGPLKSFTAFSKEAYLFNHFKVCDTWHDALYEIGNVYRQSRLNLEGIRHEWNKRALIAMPIEAKNESIPSSIRNGRHAKPYFLHVNKISDGKYQGQILFLPYIYKSGHEDKISRFIEYKEVCKKMNEEIAKGMGGSK
ncbi:CRISPR-associated protein, Cmr1 family [Syntrophus gentianae]|uniref:CRISPR-associated protein, Cmr1 family n=1 Tax=Syntrophus gentianae TaxID=43775 RepID=A0A1H7ZJP7_9BACT|nr:type III-B CRISPR module RAMP protein Cmr1 [Syntrophus gentianae]SEM58630.1 CRISPR-associated protein, Cmr1 family [Syntrophus gentianae]